ncbi:nucleotidyltransferase domain-containing protein [Salinarimonas sp.]|uniref:nucleotidyltransferase domain-containing protein n=1 Tax=Salinarimonas sp. TaxID=2766526 RepID=UPI0032D8D43D
MAVVTAADLQRRSAEVQRTASREPVFITHHDTPRYALLSLEDLVRTGAHRALLAQGGLPEGVRRRLEELGEPEVIDPGTELEIHPEAAARADDVVRRLAGRERDLRARGVESLWLFGSTARGDATAESDVDLIVILSPDCQLSLVGFSRLRLDFESWLARPVDLSLWSMLTDEAAERIRRDAIRVF